MSEWKEISLDELVTFQRGHDLPQTEFIDGPYLVAGSNGPIGYHNKFTTKGPGLTIGRSGNSIGVAHFYNDNFWAHNTTLYSKEFHNAFPKFVYYLLKNIDFNCFDAGSAVPTLNRNHIHPIKIKVPPLTEQESIASILTSLDDKIGLLHRQNKTLEALGETLFRQWFMEEAEEGWEATSLYDVIELVGGGTPKTEIAEYWDGDVNWISARDITPNHKGFITVTEKTITDRGVENSSTRILPKYSTVISARGTVGKYCLLAEDMAFSQSNYGIKPRYKGCYFFTYLLVASCVDELQAAAYGSVFDTITTNTFKEHMINVPTETEIQSFEQRIKPYFEKMLKNCEQIRTLIRLRDALLPKLMSGEVRVKDSEKKSII